MSGNVTFPVFAPAFGTMHRIKCGRQTRHGNHFFPEIT